MKTYINVLIGLLIFIVGTPLTAGKGLYIINSNAVEACYEVVHSYNGVENILYTSDLSDEACNLKSLVETASSADFDVVGHDYYPLLSSVLPNYNFDYTYKCALRTEVENRDAFILIAKDHLRDGKLAYRVKLKLPSAAPYDTITAIEQLLIEQKIKDKIEETAELAGDGVWGNAAAEIEGLKLLGVFVGQINSGTFNLASDLTRAGFTAEPILDDGLFIRGIEEPYIGVVGAGRVTAYDFINLKIDVNGTELLFRNIIGNGLQHSTFDIEGLAPTASTIILTDELSNNDDLTQAASAFEASDDKMIIWFHHTEDTIYTKKGFNFTAEEASLVLGHFYLQEMQRWYPGFGLDDEEPIAAKEPDEEAEYKSTPVECELNFEESCALDWQWGRNCVLHKINRAFDAGPGDPTEIQVLDGMNRMNLGIVVGLFDGLLGTLQFVYESVEAGVTWHRAIINYIYDTVKVYFLEGAWAVTFKVSSEIKEFVDKAVETFKKIQTFFVSLSWAQVTAVFYKMLNRLETWFGGFINGCPKQGYDIGKVLFEIIIGYFSGGTSVGAKMTEKIMGKGLPKIVKFLDNLHIPGGNKINGLVTASLDKVKTGGRYKGERRKALKCKILGSGCFVKGTPVLMASSSNQYSLKSAGKAMAVAAVLPIVGVPIQEVQLLDYAVAHETVNSTYETTASVDDDIYLELTGKDPYTSDQQRERDKYEINDIDWHEVVFEEVYGSSTAKFALHIDWIKQKSYQADAVVNLDLPEQGINGPFRITSIKHILPQKKPTDDDKSDDYDYRPVTALFTHVSDQVYNISFDNGEELGVTYQHPIYSVTAGDWKLAGELVTGEKVLTKSGETTVTRLFKKEGKELVYNLEIKDLHNFLVGQSGIVVHNDCFLSNKDNLPTLQLKPGWENDVQTTRRGYFANPAGIFKNAQGRKTIKLADPDNAKSWQWEQGFDFVITENGELKIGNGHGFLSGHTSPNVDPKIFGAGKIKINKISGKVEWVSDRSGHYAPNASEFLKIKQKFIDEGLLY
jgi:hypothetical protein